MLTLSEEEFKRFHYRFFRQNLDDKNSFWFFKSINYPRNRWLLNQLTTIEVEVLDLCGGYGVMGAYLKIVKGFRLNYTCLDINKDRIEGGSKYFHALGLQGQFIRRDIRKRLPFPEDEFDVVYLLGWCDPYYDCDELFSEIWRVLKPNGKFLFNMAKKGHYKTRMKRGELIVLLTRQNFKIVSLKTITDVDYGVIAKKGEG